MSSRVHLAAVAVSIVIFASYIDSSNALRLSDLKSLSDPKGIEGRSLLDLLLGSATEGNAATSVKVSSSAPEKNSPVIDLAQSLIGKDNVNTNLYIKIFKLIFNLFMDMMMDRMDLDLRREDFQQTPMVSFLRHPKNVLLKRSPIFERPTERQRIFKPTYLVE